MSDHSASLPEVVGLPPSCMHVCMWCLLRAKHHLRCWQLEGRTPPDHREVRITGDSVVQSGYLKPRSYSLGGTENMDTDQGPGRASVLGVMAGFQER